MEDKGSHGTFNESDIKELFERRHVLDKLQKKGKVLRSIVPICREVINDVQSLRSLEDRTEVLQTVKEKLKEIRVMLKGSIKTYENLLLEPQETENRKRKINLKSH